MKKTVIIQGSSRNNGNTQKIVDYIGKKSNSEIIHLSDMNIEHFDYAYQNQNDDFLPLITHIINNYDKIIFATPVYWYAMSGRMKVFFDRISDLLQLNKELGRRLRGKYMGLVICGSGPEVLDTFSVPFKSSADYLGMHYMGDVHTWINTGGISETAKKNMDVFISELHTFE